MFGYTEFKRVSAVPTCQVDIARFYDTKTTNKGGKLIGHEIGWTIRVREVGNDQVFGYFHVHWKPKDSEESTVNNNISAHFKESHKGNKSSNRNTASMDLKALDAALMYNGLGMLLARWDAYSPTKPQNAATGWTSLSTRITQAMVDAYKQSNNDAALKMLAQNPLYDLNKWDNAAWSSFLEWMTGG